MKKKKGRIGSSFDDFLKECIPKLQSYGRPEEVRVVFWFVD